MFDGFEFLNNFEFSHSYSKSILAISLTIEMIEKIYI